MRLGLGVPLTLGIVVVLVYSSQGLLHWHFEILINSFPTMILMARRQELFASRQVIREVYSQVRTRGDNALALQFGVGPPLGFGVSCLGFRARINLLVLKDERASDNV